MPRKKDDDDRPFIRPFPPPPDLSAVDKRSTSEKAAERAAVQAAQPYAKQSPRGPKSARSPPLPMPLILQNLESKQRAYRVHGNLGGTDAARLDTNYDLEKTRRQREAALAVAHLAKQRASPRRMDAWKMPPVSASSIRSATVPMPDMSR